MRLLAATLLAGLVLWLPTVVLAHAQLLAVDPPDGASLSVAPGAVTLRFNEPVGLATGGIRVLDGSGRDVAVDPESVDGPVVRQPLPPLPDGSYLVTWGIVSEDGHILRAASVFAVGAAALVSRPADGGADAAAPLVGLARGLTDLGVLVAAGAWVAWWLLRARTQRVRRLARAATALALVATAAWALLEWIDGGGAWGTTPAALAALVRLVLLGMALACDRRRPAVAAVAVLTALVTLVGGGHAVESLLTGVLEGVHLLLAAVWLGAAPAVLLVLTDRGVDESTAVTVVRRFSSLAAIALVVIGVAGVSLALVLTDGLAGGLTTPYVLVLTAKVAVVATAALIGALARLHLRGSPARRTLRRVFALDATLLVGVVALSSMLTLSGPHEGHAGHAGHLPMGSARCSTEVGPASVSVVLAPAQPGSNELRLIGLPATVLSVDIELSHALSAGAPMTVRAGRSADAWVAEPVLPLAGVWQATVAARLDRFTEARGTCDLTVGR